ncbi:hypothetical protein NKR23_g7369 [Pleurostoma richardsiae]|uniref:DUF7053 domain-containing protein n=1 Tax=Pleurostoma richardsiae TaxID=41990 RepID=A0AA38RAC9_9PEZI|nr:hypothetical protein NKR23_g7369 [Pleurostoma richardsiae]
MSFFNTSATVSHSSKLPAGSTHEAGIKMLQDHEFFLHCDPHMTEFKLVPLKDAAPLPDSVKPLDGRSTQAYQVTDMVHTLPAGLWDSNVISTYEFTDIEGGLFVRIRSPLSIVMDTIWQIKEGDDGGLELVEDVSINCTRLLVGVVKSQCENGWQKIHAKMMSRLEGGSSHTNGAAA